VRPRAAATGTAVHITDAAVGSDEWREARRLRINGSEIAAVLGISPFESTFSLWHRKAGAISDVESTEVMYWGVQLEPVIRAEWNRRHPDMPVAETGQWAHRDRLWQGGSPDGIGPGRLWEAKTSRHGDGWGEPGTDQIPVHYRAQVLWYLDVFGWEHCDLSVLIAGSEYREYTVAYDTAEVEPMRLKARSFLDSLAAEEPPPIDGHNATYQAVREMHPDIDPETVELSAAVAVPYLDAVAACADADTEKRRCSAELIAVMGRAQHATFNSQRIASRVAPKTDGKPPYLRAVNGATTKHRSAAA
jgi:putative phage-type endonuclease